MRRTKEQAAATRQTILRAADELFVEHGFDGVSLDEIAAAAGVKRGAVHFHFVNKPGVLLAILEGEKLPFQEVVDRFEGNRSMLRIEDVLSALVEDLRSFQGDRRRRALLRGFMTVALKLDDETHVAYVAFERRLLQLVLTAIETAAAKRALAAPWTARSAALVVHSCVTGLLMQWVTTDSDTPLSPDGVDVFRALIASFGGAGPLRRGSKRPNSAARTPSRRKAPTQ